MKKIAKTLALFAAISLGAFVAHGADTREIKIGRTEAQALQELGRRGQEIDQARKQLEAAWKKFQSDTAEIHSEIRHRYGVEKGEEFQAFNSETLVLTVGAAKMPEPPAAPGSGTK